MDPERAARGCVLEEVQNGDALGQRRRGGDRCTRSLPAHRRTGSSVLEPKHLREVLAECEGHIWWAEPTFDKAALDPLVEIVDAERINEIKILTGTKPSPTDVRNAFAPFITEMKALGIDAEIRHVAKPDLALHDRFIVGKNVVWNVPPSGVVTGKGSYSQFKRIDPAAAFRRLVDEGFAGRRLVIQGFESTERDRQALDVARVVGEDSMPSA